VSDALAPLVWTLAALLTIAGIAKLRHPAPAANAMGRAGFGAGRLGARLTGLLECGIGVWVLVDPSVPALGALALAYATAASGIWAMRRADVDDCGCFGETASLEPSRLHLAVNLMAAATCALAALSPPPGLWQATERAPLEAVAILAGVAAATVLSYLAFTALPAAWSAYGGGQEAR
jgi:methylamine utilization protein MauE